MDRQVLNGVSDIDF